MTTIKEIAEAAGFSAATVSRVLNYDETLSVSQQTRQKIFQVAENLDYMPSTKRTRGQKRKKRIAIVQWFNDEEELNDTYFFTLRMKIEQEATKQQFSISQVLDFEENADLKQVDAIIAIGKFSKYEANLLLSYQKPLCFVDDDPITGEAASITINFEQAVRNVLNYLGTEDTYFIGGQISYKDNSAIVFDERAYYFKKIMNENGLENHSYIGEYNNKSGYQIMKKLLSSNNPPKNIFAGSDTIALGVVQAIKKIAPEKLEAIKVVGFDNLPFVQYIEPQLTTVMVPLNQMAELAIEYINLQLKENPVVLSTKLSTSIIIRNT